MHPVREAIPTTYDRRRDPRPAEWRYRSPAGEDPRTAGRIGQQANPGGGVMLITDRIAVLNAVCKMISGPVSDDRLNQLEMIYRKAILLVSEEPATQKDATSEQPANTKAKVIKIYWKPNESLSKTAFNWLWAWEESARMNIWGGSRSLEEILFRAERMFPGYIVELLPSVLL